MCARYGSSVPRRRRSDFLPERQWRGSLTATPGPFAPGGGERDREKRALGRLMLSVLVTTGLVLAFGGAALRKQRKEVELSRDLGIAELPRSGDETLAQAQRVATMGTFAMGIAHEVSTPLGVIMGRAEQLLGRVKD